MIVAPISPNPEFPAPLLGEGIYTLPDAARLLSLPHGKLRNWVSGYLRVMEGEEIQHRPAGAFEARGEGREKTFNFWTLVEISLVAKLRSAGLSMPKIRKARKELAERFKTRYPFALEGILTDRREILKSLGDGTTLLELGKGGVTSLEAIVAPFCVRLDFDAHTHLAERFYPDGRNSPVVVDPHRSFGRPVLGNTGIATESLAALLWGGETIEDVAASFDLDPEDVRKAWIFEQRMAA